MASNGLLKTEQIGFLADDSTFRVHGEDKVANFRVITNEFWTDKTSGERQERAEGVRYELWGETAEHFNRIMKKGGRVYVESRLRNHQEKDEKSGEIRYSIRFRVIRWLNLDRNEGGEGRAE